MTDFIEMKLPDGSTFQTWEVAWTPTRTYHVAQRHPAASDDNEGSEAAPFRTIQRAAAVLLPGERVIVHAGVYREWVRPQRGGDGPARMIWYQAADGEPVTIKGSDEWRPQWTRSRYIRSTRFVSWEAALTGSMFAGANPFCLANGYMDRNWDYSTGYELRRGMLFLDGQPLRQVADPGHLEHLDGAPGAFWVEENGMAIHLRLAGERDPDGLVYEITTREQVLAPAERYLNYIRVSGFRMLHAANGVPIPWPQRGLLSATAGHHWIVEDCEIAHANTIGMDLGGQWWYYGQGECQGHHIVRRNYIHHFGVCGIAGWHNRANENLLVEDNLLTDNCTMQVPGHCENAAIKIHRTVNALIRRNVIVRTWYGAAIWLDGEIYNTRITQNVCLENHDCCWGQIFLEINEGPNLVDNNVLFETHRWDWGGGIDPARGFHSHDAEKVVIAQNLILGGEDEAIHVARGNPERTGRPFENDFRIWGNILGAYRELVFLPNDTSRSNHNLFAVYPAQLADAFVADGEHRLSLEAWRQAGQDADSVVAPLLVSIDKERLTLSVRAAHLERLPKYAPPGELLPGLVTGKDAFTLDLLSRDRRGVFGVGPIADLPLDGTEVSIDPRRLPGRTRA